MPLETNVSESERRMSAGCGALLVAYGLKQRSGSGALLAASGGALILRGSIGHCPAYAFLGATTAPGPETRRALSGPNGVLVDVSVTVSRPNAELYQWWRQLENLPSFMTHLQSVTQTDARRSHWVAKAPAGRTVSWDAEIINDAPNELIGWRTLDGADLVSAGSVRFKPTGKDSQTEVHVRMQYAPPAGRIGAAIAWMLGGDPARAIREDLRRFKALMEAGEVPTTDGQPRGLQSILNYD